MHSLPQKNGGAKSAMKSHTPSPLLNIKNQRPTDVSAQFQLKQNQNNLKRILGGVQNQKSRDKSLEEGLMKLRANINKCAETDFKPFESFLSSLLQNSVTQD